MSTAMIAITTKSSMSVNAARRDAPIMVPPPKKGAHKKNKMAGQFGQRVAPRLVSIEGAHLATLPYSSRADWEPDCYERAPICRKRSGQTPALPHRPPAAKGRRAGKPIDRCDGLPTR